MKPYIPIALALLLLGGCAQWGARALVNADNLATRIEERARDNFDERKWYRDQCFEIKKQVFAEMREEKQYIRAMQFLTISKPSLLTVQIIESAVDGDGDFNLPRWECKIPDLIILNPETGLLEWSK